MVFRMLARHVRVLACLVFAFLLASCGGGSGGGGDPQGGAYTVQQRNAATARVAEHFEQIVGSGEATPAQWEELRAWVVAQPEFSDAGIGDQLLWARFTDGRSFLYTDNWRPVPGAQAAALRAAQARALPLLKGTPGLPQSEDALLLRFFGDEFLDGVPAMQRMENALMEHGWKVAAGRALTIAALKNAGELGFLFLTSHSGQFGPTGHKEFAVMTDDQVSDANDADLAEDLGDGSLIYHRDRKLWQQYGLGNNPRYAVTSKFVRKHMKFSAASLVVLLSCHSGSGGGADAFRQALLDRGAGTVVGWDGNSNGYAFEMVDQLVDRLAGMNAVDPVSPPNRPHVFDEVWAYLDAKGLLVTPPAKSGDAATPVVRFGSGFSILQPIVSELELTGTDKLVVHGEFGAGPVKVSVGGQEFPAVLAADGKSIDVDLGFAPQGRVVVTSLERTSNPRVLGSWRGQVKYMQRSGTGSCGPVFTDTITLQLHLRADMHGTRDKLDGAVRDNRRIVLPSGDSQGTWTSQGQCLSSDGSVEERWSGSGAFPLYLYDTRQPVAPDALHLNNVLLVRIDAVERRFQLALSASPVAQHKSVFDGATTNDEPLAIRPDLQSYLNLAGDFTHLMPYGMFLPLDTGYGVAAQTYVKQSPSEADQKLTVEWQAMPVAPDYDDEIGW